MNRITQCYLPPGRSDSPAFTIIIIMWLVQWTLPFPRVTSMPVDFLLDVVRPMLNGVTSDSTVCRGWHLWFQSLGKGATLQPITAGLQFRMQGWDDQYCLVHTYQGGIPARRRSPIPVLTGLNVEQLRSCDERRYHYAKPSIKTERDWTAEFNQCSVNVA